VLNPPKATPEPKASRVRVWQAADRILRSGRRPTVEGVRELLGGGSPNSITAYINDWYRELGARLALAETPLAGFPADAVSLLTELWRLAAADQGSVRDRPSGDDAAERLRDAEKSALEAQTTALETLNQELQRHRASAEKSLAETRALLARREAALEDERSRVAALDQALANTRLELEVARERHRLASARTPVTVRRSTRPSKLRRRKASSAPKRALRMKRAKPVKRAVEKTTGRQRTRQTARSARTPARKKR
jgi:hypothetical protein